MKSFLNVKAVIDTLLDQEYTWKQQLYKEWHQIVGDLSCRMRIEKVYDDTLYVGVYDSAWMQELYMLSSYIIKLINKHLGYKHVSYMRFKLVSSHIKNHKMRFFKEQKRYRPPSISLTDKQLQALSVIKDEELKKSLHTFLACCVGKHNE
jgi:hypothetical protein